MEILDLLQAQVSPKEVARIIGISKVTVYSVNKMFQQRGDVKRKSHGGKKQDLRPGLLDWDGCGCLGPSHHQHEDPRQGAQR